MSRIGSIPSKVKDKVQGKRPVLPVIYTFGQHGFESGMESL